jgi:hypothetical protein
MKERPKKGKMSVLYELQLFCSKLPDTSQMGLLPSFPYLTTKCAPGKSRVARLVARGLPQCL